MKEISRRGFLKKTGKIALAGAAAFGLESGFLGGSIKLAYGEEPQAGFNVYNEVNPNAKDIVIHTFKDCLVQKWGPGICYSTSKPMVAVAEGTVTHVFKAEDAPRSYVSLRAEQTDAKGFIVKVTIGNNYVLHYVHLKTPEVKFGQKMKRGQIIGYPDGRWDMPRLILFGEGDVIDPNYFGIDHGFMTYWDGATDLEIGKVEQNKRVEKQIQILNNIAGMVEGPEKYTLLRKKHKGVVQYKWSNIEKFRYIEYLHQNKPETFPSLTKEQFEGMRKEFYSNQPIVLTLPFKKG